MEKDDTIFTVRGRLRLVTELNNNLKREIWFACDRGFQSNDNGITISDKEMVGILTEKKVNISKALLNVIPNEDIIINSKDSFI